MGARLIAAGVGILAMVIGVLGFAVKSVSDARCRPQSGGGGDRRGAAVVGRLAQSVRLHAVPRRLRFRGDGSVRLSASRRSAARRRHDRRHAPLAARRARRGVLDSQLVVRRSIGCETEAVCHQSHARSGAGSRQGHARETGCRGRHAVTTRRASATAIAAEASGSRRAACRETACRRAEGGHTTGGGARNARARGNAGVRFARTETRRRAAVTAARRGTRASKGRTGSTRGNARAASAYARTRAATAANAVARGAAGRGTPAGGNAHATSSTAPGRARGGLGGGSWTGGCGRSRRGARGRAQNIPARRRRHRATEA
jgi:hypothetical protein